MKRGRFEFEVTRTGEFLDKGANVEALRRLWLDRTLISGEDLGPGDPGDFDFGAWHVACHVCGAGGVRRTKDGRVLWLQISHDPARDDYYGSVTVRDGKAARTHRIASAEGVELLSESTLLGYVEGTSVGRVSARGANDPPTLFNLWRRQDFDRPPGFEDDGGRVWEHWCTLRDIRPAHRIGNSVLGALVSLTGALGDGFVATVTRGRRDYGHPRQLCAMVQGGLVSVEAATRDLQPQAIPAKIEAHFLAATEAEALQAIEHLTWGKGLSYFMFSRKIASWSKVADVEKDLDGF